MITVGAILRYAVKDTWSAVNIPTVGLILMLVGVFGLALGIYFTFIRRDPRAAERIIGEPPPPPRY